MINKHDLGAQFPYSDDSYTNVCLFILHYEIEHILTHLAYYLVYTCLGKAQHNNNSTW